MNLFKTLFLNSFQKEVRSKTFWFMLISSLFVMFSARSFFNFFMTKVSPVLALSQADVFFYTFVIVLWSYLMMALLGGTSIKSDMRYGMTEQILSFPIRSEHYLLIRTFSTALIIWFFYLLLLVIMFSFLLSTNSALPQVSSLLVGAVLFIFPIWATVLLATFWAIFLGTISGFLALFLNIFLISYAGKIASEMGLFFGPLSIFHLLFPHVGTWTTMSSTLLFSWNLGGANLLFEIPHFILSTSALFFVIHYLLKKRGFR